MRIRWLGWAGVELEAEGERMVIDPLQDAGAVFAWLGDRAGAIPIPDVIPAQPGAIAGVLTHLHRDHADAAALSTVLGAGATVYEPVDYGGESRERLAVVQADHELTAADWPASRPRPGPASERRGQWGERDLAPDSSPRSGDEREAAMHSLVGHVVGLVGNEVIASSAARISVGSVRVV
ncbi:MAG TPA: hypothetical protein VG365_07845 [Solirubrobacteraceae bacterium]|nr:hypothetical protein [Solirubrobacteraceae bacterium]